MQSKQYYETMYGDDRIRNLRPNRIYRMLARFSVDRYQLATQLAPGGERLLDIGCGDGELLFMLKDKYERLYGLDIAENRINRVTDYLKRNPNISLTVQDANEKLKFDDSFFSTIVILAVLEHVIDPSSLIKECYRLLQAGGTLIVEVPNVSWLPRRLGILFGGRQVKPGEIGWDGGHLHDFTRESLRKLLVNQGFKVTRITSGGIFAGPRRLWGSVLAADIVVVGIKE